MDVGNDENSLNGRATSTNGGRSVLPLEVETLGSTMTDPAEERDSLLREVLTGDEKMPLSALERQHITLRKNAVVTAAQQQTLEMMNATGAAVQRIRGFVRESLSGQYTGRNVALLMVLALLALFAMEVLDEDMEQINLANASHVEPRPPHAGSFGGPSNQGHASKNDNTNDGTGGGSATTAWDFTVDDNDEYSLPKSNVGFAVHSLSNENNRNFNGHYLHDPFQNPFASNLYAPSGSDAAEKMEYILKERQEEFDAQRKSYMKQYGFWVAPNYEELGVSYYHEVPYRDLDADDFLPNAWQRDESYVRSMITQAKQLVARVKEGIYHEYGFNSSTVPEADRDKFLEHRNGVFGVLTSGDYTIKRTGSQVGSAYTRDGKKIPCVAHMNMNAWHGLIRKLLHAMMTQDHFYVVAAGPSPCTSYLANNWFLTQMMQFNYIMEPVLDKLGVRLITRNMAMDASTTVSALGGADIYGEADIFWYIPDKAAKSKSGGGESDGQLDLLHKQTILSGERMPIILTPDAMDLQTDTENKAWFGNIQPGAEFVCPETKLDEKGEIVKPTVPACEFVRCSKAARDKDVCNVYNSVCWVDRVDGFAPSKQSDEVPGSNLGCPSFREHQWEGRKLAMMVLHALDAALEIWEGDMKQGNMPLSTHLWHVKAEYEGLRESVRVLRHESDSTACEAFLKKLDPMICHMEMHAYTEWTPRVDPANRRLRKIVTGDIGDFVATKNASAAKELYAGIDLLPLKWKVPSDQIDVHMLAIVTNNTRDDFVADEGSPEDDIQEGDAGRRLQLSQPTRIASQNSDTTTTTDKSLRSLSTLNSKWVLFNNPSGFCDGSAQSRCNRVSTNHCLLANHNHYKGGLLGHSQSGWLELKIDNIKEGIVLARFDWETDPDTGEQLVPGQRLQMLPADFQLEYSINKGAISKKFNRTEFVKFGVNLTNDLIVYPLLINKRLSHQKDAQSTSVELKIRVQSREVVKVILSHIYYA